MGAICIGENPFHWQCGCPTQLFIHHPTTSLLSGICLPTVIYFEHQLADAILSHSSPTSTRTDSALELVGELEELDPDDSGNAELTPIHPRSHTRPGRNFEEEQGLAESGRGRITREERRLLFQEGSNELIPEDEEGEWEDNHGPLADTLFDAGVGHGHGKARGQVSIGDVEDNHKKYHKRRSDDWTSNENEALMSSLRSFGDSGQQVPGSLPRSRVGVDSERRTFSRHGTGKGLSAQAGAILVRIPSVLSWVFHIRSNNSSHFCLCPVFNFRSAYFFSTNRAYTIFSLLFPNSL